MRITKKAVSLVLAMLMITSLFTIVPMTASAAPPEGGAGGITVDPVVITPTTAGDDYLTFTAEEADSSVTLNYRYGSNFKYNKNNTVWQDYTKGSRIDLENVGDSVRFSGKDAEFNDYNHVSLTGKVACSGSVMSLRLDDNGKSQGLINYCFQYMFYNCTGLTTAPELPETTLAKYCYGAMFGGCTSLTKAPDLPATNLAESCYRYMFRGCTSLTELPALPATTLADECYGYMFYDCSKIRISDVAGKFGGITYSTEYRIPTTGTGTVTPGDDPLDDMFKNTGGEFTGTPNINTTYYLPAPAHTHVMTAHEAVAATCTTAGTSAYWECTDCGKFFSDEDGNNEIADINAWLAEDGDGYVAATGHNKTHYPAVAATFDAPGNIEYWYCSGCEKYFSDENCENEITQAQTIIPQKVAVAQIGSTKYGTLQDALDVVPEGGTVTVLKDVTTSGNIFADGYVSGGNRTYTVDLGGYTVSGASFSVADGNDVTFTNGTITSASVAIQNAATTTVDTSATVISTVANNAAVYGLTGSNTIINGTVEGNKYGVFLVGTANGTINGSVSGTSRGLYVKGTGTVGVTGTINAGDRGVTVENGATVNLNDGAEVTAPFGVVALKDATVNVNEGSEITSSIHAISGNGTSGDGGYEININGGTITATGDQAAIYHPNTGELNISGGTIASDTASAIVVKSGSTEISGGTITSEGGEAVKYDSTGSGYAPFKKIAVSGGTFNKPVPADYYANGYAPKDNGNGTYGVGPDTSSPLNPLEKAVADINDGNKFGLECDYLKGTLLGVQKKDAMDSIDKIPDSAHTSESGQETGNDIRFVAVLDTDLINDPTVTDYGFVLAKANQKTKYSDVTFDNLKANWGNGEKTISAKGTYNNICGDERYGDPTNTTTDYKYITCAVNGMSNKDMVVARFYVVKGGKTYYAKYAGHNYKYTGCMTKADLAPVED